MSNYNQNRNMRDWQNSEDNHLMPMPSVGTFLKHLQSKLFNTKFSVDVVEEAAFSQGVEVVVGDNNLDSIRLFITDRKTRDNRRQ